MNTIKLATTVLIAGSILATPAIAQERKTLFQVLFPKAHERQMERQRARQEALQASENPVPKKLPKVASSRNYVYKVAAFAPVAIKPAEVEFAAVETGEEGTRVAPPEPTIMTSDLLLSGSDAIRAEKHIAEAVSAYYSQNQDYRWIDDKGEWNARARAAIRVLEDAESYGLRASDYTINVEAPETAEEAATAAYRLKKELALSIAVVRYAMDAEFGTINPNRLSGYHDFPVHDAQTPVILDEVFGPGLPANTLVTFHPTNEKFEALRNELASLQTRRDDVIDLPAKILIKPGQRHEELPKFIEAIKKRGSDDLKAAHDKTLSLYLGELQYSEELVALVKDYQKEAGLGADGIIGRNTSAKLAGISSADRETTVKLAMERLRWLPDELGDRHVFINQPEFVARYIEDGKENLSMRVVVGKKSNQTNFFYDEIEHVEYNPYWGVPRSIIVNEFLAKSISNPGYLDQKGYEVTTFSGKRIPASSINWSQVGANPNFAVRQPPGKANALGELKIMFPNKHAIYMHDTPAKSLFKRDTRAFSHGCVRLHDPHAMAAAVLGKTKAQVKASIAGGRNQTEKLSVKMPVYVSYFTAWPQADGKVKYFADMYGRDAHLLKAIEATKEARASAFAS
ncbi:MAG: L,D-transpeptidase family protein [Pseudomonadota bacterium]